MFSFLVLMTALAALPAVLKNGREPEEDPPPRADEESAPESSSPLDEIFPAERTEDTPESARSDEVLGWREAWEKSAAQGEGAGEGGGGPRAQEMRRLEAQERAQVGGEADPVERERPTQAIEALRASSWPSERSSELALGGASDEREAEARSEMNTSPEPSSMTRVSQLQSARSAQRNSSSTRIVKPTPAAHPRAERLKDEERARGKRGINPRRAAEGAISAEISPRDELRSFEQQPLLQSALSSGMPETHSSRAQALRDHQRLEELFIDFVLPTPESADTPRPLKRKILAGPYRTFQDFFGVRESYLDYESLTQAYLLTDPEGWWDALSELDRRDLEEQAEPSPEAEAARRFAEEEERTKNASENWNRLLEPAYDFHAQRRYRREEQAQTAAQERGG